MTASHSATPSTKHDASTFISDHRAVDRSKLSQMYQHYIETKEKYPHAMLLYRVGDFFECYFEMR
jgi:DNA mismatch repair protein MutS